MTELDAGLVRRKLASMLRNLEDLAFIEGLSVAEYREDRFRRKATERMLQEVVEAAVDVNLHLLRAHGQPPAADYFTSFLELGRLGVIDGELANQLAPSAGLRNRLVHEYDAIDHSIVLKAVGEARRHYERYAEAVERHLEDAGF